MQPLNLVYPNIKPKNPTSKWRNLDLRGWWRWSLMLSFSFKIQQVCLTCKEIITIWNTLSSYFFFYSPSPLSFSLKFWSWKVKMRINSCFRFFLILLAQRHNFPQGIPKYLVITVEQYVLTCCVIVCHMYYLD